MLIWIWSAIPVQDTQFLPVFHFYASLPRTSLFQCNASTGAKWPQQYSFAGLLRAPTFVSKPDSSGSGPSSEVANGGTENRQEPQNAHFLTSKNTNLYLEHNAFTLH